MNKESNEVYVVKAALVILVIIGHAIQYSFSKFDLNYDSNLIFRIIYMFHMPAFGFLSGYLIKNISFSKILTYARVLLLPFLIWALIFDLYREEDQGRLVRFVELVVFESDKSLWFLLVIFECAFLFWIISAFGGKDLRRMLIYTAIFQISIMFIVNFLGIYVLALKQLIYIFPFYVLGIMARRSKSAIREIVCRRKIKLFILPLVILSMLGDQWARVLKQYDSVFFNAYDFVALEFYLMKMIIASCYVFIILLFILCCNLKSHYGTKIISKESLSYYALQFVFIDIYLNVFDAKDFGVWFYLFGCVIFVLISVYLSITLLSKVRFIKVVLCGR